MCGMRGARGGWWDGMGWDGGERGRERGEGRGERGEGRGERGEWRGERGEGRGSEGGSGEVSVSAVILCSVGWARYR